MINEDVYNRILDSLDENERENIADINRSHELKDQEYNQQKPLEKFSSHSTELREKKTATSAVSDILEKLENVASQLLAVTRKAENIQNFDEASVTEPEISFASNNETINAHKDCLYEHNQKQKKKKLIDVECKGSKRKLCHEEGEGPKKTKLIDLSSQGVKRKTSDEGENVFKKQKLSDYEASENELGKSKGLKRKNASKEGNNTKKMKPTKGTKRKMPLEDNLEQPKKRKLNCHEQKGLKRKNCFDHESYHKKRKVSFDMWE